MSPFWSAVCAKTRSIAKWPARSPSWRYLEIVQIGQLQLYNQDADLNPPAECIAFRERMPAGRWGHLRDAGI
jgi:hypothetical protein